MNSSRAILITQTLVLWWLINYLGTLAMFGLGRLFGVRALALTFGAFRVFHKRRGSTTYSIGWLPIQSYVQFADNRFENSEYDPQFAMDSRPPWIRFLVPFSGIVIFLLPACVIFGASCLERASTAIPQLVQGALHPLTQAQLSLRAYESFAAEYGFFSAFALAIFKYGILMLLPFSPSFGLGQCIVAMLPRLPMKVLGVSANLTFVGHLLFTASWATAMLMFIFS